MAGWQKSMRRFAQTNTKGSSAASMFLVAMLTFALSVFGIQGLVPPANAQAAACAATDPSWGSYTYANGYCTLTVNYTGAAQTWTVPQGVTDISFNVTASAGGRGLFGSTPGTALGGNGGTVAGHLTVTGGTVLNLYVGGQGTPSNSSTPGTGGWNGGGAPGVYPGCGPLNAAGGGGASDIRIGGTALANRVVVAGGGGGGGSYTCASTSDIGGNGGSNTSTGAGADGQYAGAYTNAWRGQGATQSAGGAGGNGTAYSNGALGVGGAGFSSYPGGGGGGGYYGGGGAYIGAGGGGSSWYDSTKVTGATYSSTNTGTGTMTLTYLAGPTVTTFSATNATATNSGFISGRSINYTINWSMAVTGFTTSTISLSGTSGASGTWTKTLTGSGAGPYYLTLANASAIEGDVTVTIDSTQVRDASNNPGVGGPYVNTTTIDTIAPTVSAISWTNNSVYQTSQQISVTFSEPVVAHLARLAHGASRSSRAAALVHTFSASTTLQR
jgi:Glycine rich protein